jgi:aryl-alcohol dehydrogenase-like predicted oxidoreductase
LEVSTIGLGCIRLSANSGDPVHTDHGIQLIWTAHELGVMFIDTADAYRPYTYETLVGQALAPIPYQVIRGTKFGFEFTPTRPRAIRRTSPWRRSTNRPDPVHSRGLRRTRW